MEEDYAVDVDIYGIEEAINQMPMEGNQNVSDDSQILKDEMDIEAIDEDNLDKRSRKRKKKTSKVWEEFIEVTLKDGTKKLNCKYCNAKLSVSKYGSTSHLIRHMKGCSIRLASISTITLDNSSSNDSVVRHLKESFALKGNLFFNGRLFHVRCTTHILNLLVQDGLAVIEPITHNVRVTVKYLKMSPQHLHKFSEIVKNLQLPSSKRLVLDVPTRWNSTYIMLECALQFKDVFPMYKERDPYFHSLPTSEEWKVAENVMKFLEVFYEATMVFSGNEYPTSNLFLPEIWKIKELLNRAILDKSGYMQAMAHKMKDKFDKYWGNCNLLITIASILDPRFKMHFVKFCFPRMYTTEFEANRNLTLVENAIRELFDEYIASYNYQQSVSTQAATVESSSIVVGAKSLTKSRNEFETWAQSTYQVTSSSKSELEIYLEGGRLCGAEDKFDALEWWKENTLKFKILSKMAKDILSIPATSVASEATFSAGGRVLNQFRSSLNPQTVEVLICTGDWVRSDYKLKMHQDVQVEELETMIVKLSI